MARTLGLRGAPLLAILALTACVGTPVVRHGPPSPRVVARTWKMPPGTLRSKILDAFTANAEAFPAPFNRMTVQALRLPRFPANWIASFVDPGDALEGYKQLAPEVRRDDLWLEEPTGDVYWPSSEYATPAGPARFRCGLIIHLGGIDAGTRVDIYETVPTVWAGEHWAFAAHGLGFGRFHDIRFVEPSVDERQRVLDLIDRIVTP